MTKQDIIDRIRAMKTERNSLREQLQVKAAELLNATAARDRLQAFIALPDWASLDGEIEAGTIVRFGALTYRAKSTHTKLLTRSPINLIYWEVVTDGG